MAQAMSRAEYLRKALANFNMRCVVGKTPGEVTVHHPGITYSDLSTNSRYPTVWNLQRIVEGIRFFAHHKPDETTEKTYLEYDKVTKDRFTFIASTEFHISPALYDYLTPKGPLVAHLQLNHVGRASISTNCHVSVPETQQELLRNTNGVISVDKEKRTPTSWPESWIDRYKPHATTDVAFRITRKPHPEDSFCKQAIVRWSDTDYYKHVNWSSYVKFCLDAAILIAQDGKLETPMSSIGNHAIKYVSLAYVGESLLGDVLDVNAWESEVNQLEFDITKGDKPVCYCKVQYYNISDLPHPNLF